MYKLPIALLFVLVCGVTVSAAGQEYFPAVATYHSATGNVVLDGYPVGLLESYIARGPGVPVVAPQFKPGVLADTSIEDEVTWAFFDWRALPSSILLQDIFPANLTEDELKSHYWFGVRIWHNTGEFTPAAEWRYVPVPEASSAVLAGLGSIALLRRPRQRS